MLTNIQHRLRPPDQPVAESSGLLDVSLHCRALHREFTAQNQRSWFSATGRSLLALEVHKSTPFDAVTELFCIWSHCCDLTFFSVYSDIFRSPHMGRASGPAEQKKVFCPSNLQSVKFERYRVLINIVRKVVFHTSAMTPFLTHFMVALFITQDAFLMPFGPISFLQSWPQVYWFWLAHVSTVSCRLFWQGGYLVVLERSKLQNSWGDACRMSSGRNVLLALCSLFRHILLESKRFAREKGVAGRVSVEDQKRKACA